VGAAATSSSTTALDAELERAAERGMDENALAGQIMSIRDQLFAHYCEPGHFALQRGAFVRLMQRWDCDASMHKAQREFEELSQGLGELSVSALRTWVTKNFGAFDPRVCRMAVLELTSAEDRGAGLPALLLRAWAMQIFLLTCERIRVDSRQRLREVFDRGSLERMTHVYLTQVVGHTADNPTTKAKLVNARRRFQAALEAGGDDDGLTEAAFVVWVLEVFAGHEVILIAQQLCQGALDGLPEEDFDPEEDLLQDVRAVLQRQAERQREAADEQQQQKAAATKLGNILKSRLARGGAAQPEPESQEGSSPSSSDGDGRLHVRLAGVSVSDIVDELGLEEALKEQVMMSPHSVWRSLKARKILVQMVSAAEDQLEALLMRFEQHRRELSSQQPGAGQVDIQRWPPTAGDGTRIAHAVLPAAWEAAGTEELHGQLYEGILTAFLKQVEEHPYAKQELRQQMQALVTMASSFIADTVAEEGVIQLKRSVEVSLEGVS